MKLILFDIDETLIDSGQAGSMALNIAFKNLFSINNAFNGVSMAGKTDIQIMKEGLSKHGLASNNGIIPAIIGAYMEYLSIEINNDRKRLKPGIMEAVETIKDDNGSFTLGLLTGNIERGARIKLEPFSLNPYFASGAFGSDHEDRNSLLPIAVERFNKITGKTIEFRDCVIIGDTPRDVYCAKPYGAKCIAVATGHYPENALKEAGADVVMTDLSDTKALLSAIRGE